MNQAPKFTRRARWAVPSGAVAAVGVVVAGSVLTSAQAAPSLQARTPAQLLQDMHTALTGAEAGLVGYWTFDTLTGADAAALKKAATASGPVDNPDDDSAE